VPGAVLTDEGASRECRPEPLPGAEGQRERGGVGPDRKIRRNGSVAHGARWRLDADVHVLAVIAVRPAVESAFPDRSDVVRDEVAADFVAFVDCRPEGAAPRIDCKPGRIAQAGRDDASGPVAGIDLPDRRAAFL